MVVAEIVTSAENISYGRDVARDLYRDRVYDSLSVHSPDQPPKRLDLWS